MLHHIKVDYQPTTDSSFYTSIAHREADALNGIVPSYHTLYANSETVSVWCKTGRRATLQVSDFLYITGAVKLRTCPNSILMGQGTPRKSSLSSFFGSNDNNDDNSGGSASVRCVHTSSSNKSEFQKSIFFFQEKICITKMERYGADWT